MKNLYSIAVKYSRIIVKSSIHCNATFFSRHLTSEMKLRKLCTKEKRPTCADSTLEAIKTVSAGSTKKSRGNPKSLYLVDEQVAKNLAALVVTHRSAKTAHVMQMNPGPGLLTKELLQAGIDKIEMFEGTQYFLPDLINLQLQYPDRLKLQQVDLTRVLVEAHRDWKNGTNEMDSYFVNVKKRPWEDTPSYEIIGSSMDREFIYRLVKLVVFHTNLRKFGRMALLLCVPPSVSLILNCDNTNYDLYRTPVILFRTLFRCRVLEELPRSAFYPKYLKSNKQRTVRREQLYENDDTIMHLIKIEANQHLFDDKFTEMDLLTYYYFVSHHFKARATRVIPALENWVPRCGPALIKEGLNIYTEFGDLHPDQVLNLYVQFKSLPGYKKSSFVSCMNTFFSEIENHIGFNENSESIDDIFQTSVKEFEDQTKQSTQS